MDISWPSQLPIRDVNILVEGKTDAIMVQIILDKINYPGKFNIIPCRSVKNIAHYIRTHNRAVEEIQRIDHEPDVLIALIDADELSVSDAREHARQRLQYPNIPVFCAVPTVESWLFADPELAQSAARNQVSRQSIARIIAPDTLPNPKLIARQVFGIENASDPWFFENVNLATALAHSASLADFVDGLVKALGGDSDVSIEAVGSQLSRTVFSNLLRELPAETIGWRTVNGEYTAAELAEKILLGEQVGFQYVTELLRLARDILAARSKERDE